jgi:4-amino-4-deoxy-L-arabinose transferase-like glycosyltransferase
MLGPVLERSGSRPGGWELVGLALLLAAALALRGWRLDLVPPGLSHDEAYDALNAVEILRGARPLFFESNNGREPLFMYLVALAFGALGVGPVQLRLVSALAGTAAVGLIWLLGHWAFGRRVAWSAAGLMATSFWPLFDSRIGLRAALLPALLALTALALWRWGAGGSIRWAALAGLALGLALDTYTVARFSPGIALGFAAYLAGTRRSAVGSAALGLAVLAGVAGLVFAPLGAYFASHPGSFTGRSGQVNDLRFVLQGGDFWPLIEDSLNTLGMFTVGGDQFMRYNLAGRPVFDPLSGGLFYIGLVAAARRVRGSPPAALLLLGLAVGLLPSATTGESPHFLRAIGAQPFTFLLAGLGVDAASRRLAAGSRLGVAAVALVAALSLRDYFLIWPAERGAREVYGAPMAALARQLDAGALEGVGFVSAEYPADLDRFTLDLQRGPRPADLTWFDGRIALPIRPGQSATYLIASNARPPVEMLRGLLDVEPGGGDLDLARRPAGLDLAPGHPLRARVGDALELIGFDLQEAVRPGEEARAILYWRILARPSADLSLFVHLIGGLGSLWGQRDGLGFPTEGWRPGDLLVQWHDARVPVGTPPGQLAVEAGAYRRDDGTRLPVQLASGGPADDRLRLGDLRVERADEQPEPPDPVVRVAIRFGESIRLRGFELDASAARPGGAVGATLYWQALGRVGADYTVFVHLVADAPQPVGQGDGPPAFGMYPTSLWQAGDLLRDPHEVRLAPDLARRRYWLLLGLYRPADGARLAPIGPPPGVLARLGNWLERRTPYRAGPRVDGDRVVLGAVDVR